MASIFHSRSGEPVRAVACPDSCADLVGAAYLGANRRHRMCSIPAHPLQAYVGAIRPSRQACVFWADSFHTTC